MRPAPLVLLAAGCLAGLPAAALEVVRAEASEDAGRYTVVVEVLIDAPREAVEAALTDFDRIEELSERFVESRSLGQPEPGVTEVLTRLRDCVAFFCKTLERVERIRETDTGLVAEDVPGRGDFRSGRTVWALTAEGERTRLVFASRLVPDFWVPPLVGPALLGARSRETTVEMMGALERRLKEER